MSQQKKSPFIDEEQIVHLLKTTEAPLGANFRQRMAKMPWMAQNKQGNINHMQQSILFNRPKQLAWGAVLLILCITVFTAVTPAGRTFAQNIIHYFQRESNTPSATAPAAEPVHITLDEGAPPQIEVPAASDVQVTTEPVEDDTQTITITSTTSPNVAVAIESEEGGAIISGAEPLELTITQDEDGLTAATTDNTGGSGGGGFATNNTDISQASKLLGYPVSTLNALPDGYQLVKVFAPIADMADASAEAFVPSFITLYYENGNDTILLTQDSHLAEDGNVGQTIGDDAAVQTVEIRAGVLAEYIRGTWVMPDGFVPEPGTDPMQSATWDNNAPNQMLVWETAGIRYELQSDSPDLGMTDLLQIAQSISE